MNAPISTSVSLPKTIQRGYECVALLLQGGGALGAYQAGVYQALSEAGIQPHWLAGISMGAINGALIAGNQLERRVERLREFWETISHPNWLPYGDQISLLASTWFDDLRLRAIGNTVSATHSMLLGQAGFFIPRVPPPGLRAKGTPGADSFYDVEPLRQTLLKLIDFDLLN
ncbi:MAG: patatin-like phospholipase family protein, partial [Burkholderiales bacterium]|nr:patatin-like phospholipase family protein [Burkholderiales bacterium]